MAATSRVFSLAALLSLTFTVAHSHSGATDTYHVSVGRLFLLRCLFADDHTKVTWSKEGRQHDLGLPSGVEVRDGVLWFLNVQMSHNGFYKCEKRDQTGVTNVTFGVSVSSGECPDPAENKRIDKGGNDGLACKQPEIFRLNNTRNVRWMKDCQPVERPEEHFFVQEDGFMRLTPATKGDAGKYTCLVDISLNGRKYTAARSAVLTINKQIAVVPVPEVLYPQQEVVVVEEGGRVELHCRAYIGYSENPVTLMYWTVDGNDSEEYKELNDTWKFSPERDKVYGNATLFISKVRRQFLNVPIYCHVSTTGGQKYGVVWLQEADHSALYTRVALCLAALLAVLGLAVAYLFFKVELVLAHRKLMSHFSKRAPDGKLYDAYVSFLPPDTTSSAETASLALHVLPEVLEKQHGYSLYIRGRDDCPGEAVHDAIAATVRQCRRLIIILSPDINTEEVSLRDNQTQLCYEQKVGLHDALTQNEPRVILVEIDGPVDYTCLPESLRYIKRKQGALKWKKPSPGSHKLTKLRSNRNFWKNLRYHMPSVPAGSLQTVV
ncbi:interleukin-1 receptor type 1 [Sebastes umbrosus]|uniref:interleukin-1 receptor type 1 n=1 Tax=Sebastes umbrosus TaxID=72105 RepID=UPI00189F90E9|nr:interleukin-1 receptor type 1 [Sebastes umbrosus]XP_037645702.1 interleukin-1 receptor type 1 [Sebastes umbrosus]